MSSRKFQGVPRASIPMKRKQLIFSNLIPSSTRKPVLFASNSALDKEAGKIKTADDFNKEMEEKKKK